MGEIVILPVLPRPRLRELRAYGTAAGLDLALFRDEDPAAYLPLRLSVVGPGPIGVQEIASFHDTAEGRRTADKVAISVLLALQHAEWTIPGSAA